MVEKVAHAPLFFVRDALRDGEISFFHLPGGDERRKRGGLLLRARKHHHAAYLFIQAVDAVGFAAEPLAQQLAHALLGVDPDGLEANDDLRIGAEDLSFH